MTVTTKCPLLVQVTCKFLISVIKIEELRALKVGISNGKTDRALTTSVLPGATIIKSGKNPTVLAAARLNFIKYQTIVCRFWPAFNSFLANTSQFIISIVVMWSLLFMSFSCE